ncbi:hypothetical protein VM1G_02383 [Cytospora mali]|uniref:Rhodopsin domain-containing protein n=1 Tax=Cytospora mali TaxID=578113 RepID=A0A194VR05_CYTMA|nr:hypothetical protein VM1G_02383 [Valsa mali]
MSSVFDLLGKVDNLNDPEPILNSKPTIFGLVISFLTFSTLCVFGRVWVRYAITHSLGWDDMFVFLAATTNILQGVGLCLTVDHGLGRHFILLGPDGMQDFTKIFYVANGAYPLSTTFIKLALLFQYLRIFEKGTKLRTVTIVAIVVVCIWGCAFTFLAWIPCVPVRAYWDWLIPDSQVTRYGYGSHNPKVFVGTYLANAATNMVLDLVTLAIPLPLWMDQGIRGKSRMALFGLFVLGAIVNVCSVIRVITIVQTQAGTYPTLDPSWYGCTAAILSALEVNLATLCASLPVFWPVIKENMGRILVTYEVQITRETRESGDFNVMNEHGEIFSMGAVSPRRKQYAEDKYIRAHTDVVQQVRPPKMTMISRGGQSEQWLQRDNSLDLGSDFSASMTGLGLQRPGIEKRGSDEGLLNAK